MKYYQQEKFYTCGCACFRMMLSHFNIEVPSEEFLEEKLNTAIENTGTHYNDLINTGREYGLEVIEGEKASIQQIDQLTKDGWVVILGISLDVPHFVIYLDNNGNHIFFNDPFRGERSSFQIKKFLRNNWTINRDKYKLVELEYPDLKFDAEMNRDKYFMAFKKK